MSSAFRAPSNHPGTAVAGASVNHKRGARQCDGPLSAVGDAARPPWPEIPARSIFTTPDPDKTAIQNAMDLTITSGGKKIGRGKDPSMVTRKGSLAGRKPVDIDMARVAALRRQGMTIEKVAREMNVHQTTLHRRLREMDK